MVGNIFVRRAVHGDEEEVARVLRQGQWSQVWPLARACMRTGWDVYLKSIALSTGVLAYWLHAQRPVIETILVTLLAWSIIWALVLAYICVQMEKEVRTALEQDIRNIDETYGPSTHGNYMWVVCHGNEVEEAEDSEQAAGGKGKAAGGSKRPKAPVVAVVALARQSGGEALVQHLAVDKREQKKKIATTLLKHVLKYAKQHDISRLVARCSTAQFAALHVLGQAGFKVTSTTKVNSWFSAIKLTLQLSR